MAHPTLAAIGRVALGTLLPIAAPAAVIGVGGFFGTGDTRELGMILIMIAFGLMLIGPYALLAALAMEFWVNRRIQSKGKVLVIGAGLGLLAAVLGIEAVRDPWKGPSVFVFIGPACGALTAWVMHRLSRRPVDDSLEAL